MSHPKLLQISLKGNKVVLVRKNLSVVLREKGGMIEENLSRTKNPRSQSERGRSRRLVAGTQPPKEESGQARSRPKA